MNYPRDMGFWLKAGPALATLIVPFLTYYLVGKKVEKYKNVLSKELEDHKLQFQATFQATLYEFQTRYSWLHQRRAETVEKLYSLVARVETDLQICVSALHELRNQTEDGHYRRTEDHFQEMINFFDEKRIYFDEEISESFFEMMRATRVIYDHYPSDQWAGGAAQEQAGWLKQRAAQLKEQNIGPLIAILEDRFRALLEAETPGHLLDRMKSPDCGPDRKQLPELGFWRRIGRLWGRRPKDEVDA